MSPRRPLILSVPFALISAATASVPSATPEIALTSFPAHRELLDMPNVIPDMEEMDDETSRTDVTT
jgi:hypothetical protein